MKEISDSLISGLVENAVERTRGKSTALQTLEKCFHTAGHWCPNILFWWLAEFSGTTWRCSVSIPPSSSSEQCGHVCSKADLSLRP